MTLNGTFKNLIIQNLTLMQETMGEKFDFISINSSSITSVTLD